LASAISASKTDDADGVPLGVGVGVGVGVVLGVDPLEHPIAAPSTAIPHTRAAAMCFLLPTFPRIFQEAGHPSLEGRSGTIPGRVPRAAARSSGRPLIRGRFER